MIRILATAVMALALIATHATAETVLRLGMTDLPTSRGNPYFSTATTYGFFYPALYDTLTMVDEDGAVVPNLAVAWEQESDLTWLITLREGVTFANGEPFDAEAVVSNVTMLRSDSAVGQSIAREIDFIVSAEARASHVVAITTSVPHALLPRYLAYFYVAAPRHFAAVGFEGLGREPAGTGAFALESWNPGRVLLAARDDAWSPAAVDGIEILEIQEPTARVQALMTGRVDVTMGLGADNIPELEAAGLRWAMRNPTRVLVMSLNIVKENSPFTDVRVRQAMNLGVNRKAITEALLGGLVEPANAPVVKGAIGYDPSFETYPYDPERAKALLSEAGFPDGFDVIFEFPQGSFANDGAIYQQAAADLAKIGVRMEIQPITFPQLIAGMTQPNAGWRGHSFSTDYSTGPTMDGLRPFRLHSCTWSAPWFCDRSIEPKLAEARSTPNEARRVALTGELLHYYHEQAESLFLFPVVGLDGLGARIDHWDPMNDSLMLHQVTLKD